MPPSVTPADPDSAPATLKPYRASGSIPWGPAAALMALCLVLRQAGLMELPIFGDEAIYLRWAQLIHQKPLANAWVSLIDPKPPLHYWLLAALWDLSADPLRVGRALSVLTAVLMIPVLFALCRDMEFMCSGALAGLPRREAAALRWPAPSGRLVGLMACLLATLCPYLAFNQRLTLADGPFALLSVLAAWASVRLALAAWSGVTLRRGFVRYSLPLGVVMGIAMLTRQNLSYTLWGLPVLAIALLARRTYDPQRQAFRCSGAGLKRAVVLLAAAGLIAGVLWSPFLLAQPGRYRTEPDAAGRTQPRFAAEFKRRVFYQDLFTSPSTASTRLAMIRRNFTSVFIPSRAADGALATGWYWLYMTPPVYLASLAALLWLAGRRQWRLLLLLCGWLALMVGPLVLMGSVMYSRYALGGVIPLLLALGFMVADMLGWLLSVRGGSPLGWVGAAALAVGLFAWPCHDLYMQTRDWPNQPLVAADRLRYVSGWSAGYGVQGAIRTIREAAADGPVVVITDDGWGTPADALWVYLQGTKNIQMYYVRDGDVTPREGEAQPILREAPAAPGAPPRYLLRMDKYSYTPPAPVAFPSKALVVYVTQQDDAEHNTADILAKANPEMAEVAAFRNPGEREGEPAADRVVIYQLQ